MKIPNP